MTTPTPEATVAGALAEAAEALARARQEAAEALARARGDAFLGLARKLDDALEGLECFDGNVPLELIEALAVNLVEALDPASEPLGEALKKLNKADSHLNDEVNHWSPV